MFQELVHWDPSRYWDQPRCLVDQGIDPEWKTLWHGSSSYGCFPSLLLAHAIGETVDLLGGSPKGESQHQDQVRLTFYRLTILKFLKMFFNFKNRELRGAIALAFGHLIGVTCGGNKLRPCKTDTINKYTRMAYEAFKSASTIIIQFGCCLAHTENYLIEYCLCNRLPPVVDVIKLFWRKSRFPQN